MIDESHSRYVEWLNARRWRELQMTEEIHRSCLITGLECLSSASLTLHKLLFFSKISFHFADVEFIKFVDHPAMAEVKERSVFIHVVLPGQEDNAADLPAR